MSFNFGFQRLGLWYFATTLLLGGLSMFEAQGSPPGNVSQAQQLWASVEVLKAPESVFVDSQTKQIFVSNIGPEAKADLKDQEGFITRFSSEGEVIDAQWAKGLNAPKGLAGLGDRLWVADIDEVLVFNIRSGILMTTLTIPGAQMLNAIAVAEDGRVFVSDSFASRIYVLSEGKVEIFAEGAQLMSPNGLWVDEQNLWVASWGLTSDWSTKEKGQIYTLDLNSKEQKIVFASWRGNFDGISRDQQGNFWISDWVAGKVWTANPKTGKTHLQFSSLNGPADLFYSIADATLYIPEMGQNRLSAIGFGPQEEKEEDVILSH